MNMWTEIKIEKCLFEICATQLHFYTSSTSRVPLKKVLQESSLPPGVNLINLVAFLKTACKHKTELQSCFGKSSRAQQAKGTQGSSEDATPHNLCACSVRFFPVASMRWRVACAVPHSFTYLLHCSKTGATLQEYHKTWSHTYTLSAKLRLIVVP